MSHLDCLTALEVSLLVTCLWGLFPTGGSEERPDPCLSPIFYGSLNFGLGLHVLTEHHCHLTLSS